MSDKINPVRPGEKLKADTINIIINRVDRITAPRVLTTAADPRPGQGTDENLIKIKNSTGRVLSRFDIISIQQDDQQTDPAYFVATLPNSELPVAVVIEPIGKDGIGLCQVYGVSQCRIHMTSESDQFAQIIEGETSHLESASAGPFRIIWREAHASPAKAMVYFPANSSEGAPIFHIPMHDHRDNANGGMSFATYAPSSSPMLAWD